MLLVGSTHSTLHTAPYRPPLGQAPGNMVPSFTAFRQCVLSAKEIILIDFVFVGTGGLKGRRPWVDN